LLVVVLDDLAFDGDFVVRVRHELVRVEIAERAIRDVVAREPRDEDVLAALGVGGGVCEHGAREREAGDQAEH